MSPAGRADPRPTYGATGPAGPTTGFVEVADRVFVARYKAWDVNVGLVLGRDGAVVIDTRASDVQGSQVLDDVRRLARDIVVRHVVNTHVHFDHTFGNAAFDMATVHAHDNVGRTLEADAERIKGLFRDDPGDGPELGYTARDAADVLATVVRGPDRTFCSHATIDLGDRAVTMAYAGRGHTDGDVAVHVPDTDALFLGDLVEEQRPPVVRWRLVAAGVGRHPQLTPRRGQRPDGRRARARTRRRRRLRGSAARRHRGRRGRHP